jgi:hypothetical protein
MVSIIGGVFVKEVMEIDDGCGVGSQREMGRRVRWEEEKKSLE